MYRIPSLCVRRATLHLNNVPHKAAAECCCRASPGNGRLLPILRDTADFAINGDFCKVCGRMFPGRRSVSRLPPDGECARAMRGMVAMVAGLLPPPHLLLLPGGGGAGNKQFLQQLLSSLIYVSTAGG